MEKKNLLMVTIVVLIVLTAYAGEPKEPKLLKEIKFDGEIKKFSGNIVVTDKELIFLDNDGNVSKKKELPERTRIEISKDGTRLGQRTAYDVTEKGPGKVEFKMLDEAGNIQWETNKFSTGVFYVSPQNAGRVILRECYEGGCGVTFKIYDKDNTQGKSVVPTVSTKSQSEGGEISYDGNYFVAIFGTSEGTSYIALFDVSGSQLWVKHINDEHISSIAISTYGNYLIAKSSHTTKDEYYIYIYNKQGDLLLKEQVGSGGYYFKFDENERYALVGSDNGELYLFDTTSPKLLWKYFTGDKDIGFKDVDLSAGFIVGSLAVRDSKAPSEAPLPKYLYLFDIKGNLLGKKKFTDHGFYSWIEAPKVKMANSGKKILFTFPKKIDEFENEFAK